MFDEPINTAKSLGQIIVSGLRVGMFGIGFTWTLIDDVERQVFLVPKPFNIPVFVPVTEYDVVDVGVNETPFVIPPLQTYVFAPEAVNVVEVPSQTLLTPVIVIVGVGIISISSTLSIQNSSPAELARQYKSIATWVIFGWRFNIIVEGPVVVVPAGAWYTSPVGPAEFVNVPFAVCVIVPVDVKGQIAFELPVILNSVLYVTPPFVETWALK